MFYIVFNSRTDTYYNQELGLWTPHLVCATFFDYQTQAMEIVNTAKERYLMSFRETEDLSKANIDTMVDELADI